MPTANILTVLLLLFTLCSAQTPPAPEPIPADGPASPANCLVSMLNLSDCLSYVQVGSTDTKPEAACCPELSGMADSSPECICNLIGGGASPRFGVKLDKQRAEELSSICGVKAPSPDLCSGSEGSKEDKKNGGMSMTTKDYGLALNPLMLALFTIFSLFCF